MANYDYEYDKEEYMHGYCEYFALAVADLFGGKVHLWLDTDYDSDEEDGVRLCHAFSEILPGVYLDADGVFKDISEREDDFEYNDIRIVSGNSKEMKEVLKKLKVPFTDTTIKRNVREYLRNNMLVFDIYYNNNMYKMGLYHIGNRNGEPIVMTVSYSGSQGFGNYVQTFGLSEFMNSVKSCEGFKENKRWYYKK